MKSFSEHPNNFFNSNIDKFNDFCIKYKNHNYISTNDKKKLKSIGVDFEKLQNKVLDCINYFKKQDIDLLNDLLYYVIDDIDFVTRFGNIWFSIKVSLLSSGYEEIVISLDANDLPSKNHVKIDSEYSIISKIVECIYYKINNEFDRLKHKKNKDIYDKYSLENLKKEDINKIILYPVINIDFNFKKDNLENNKLIFYLKDEIISRYFNQIKIEKNNINILLYNNYLDDKTTAKIY